MKLSTVNYKEEK